MLFALLMVSAGAEAFQGTTFRHKDWYLACDNTGTCRASGYSPEMADNPVAVMLTRLAGPATALTGRVYFGELSPIAALQAGGPRLFIDGLEHGALPPLEEENAVAKYALTATQVQALLAVVKTDAVIELGDGQHNWRLSGAGATAVFRKMDEYQHRLHTPSAVVVKGTQPESRAKAARDKPVIFNRTVEGKSGDLSPDSADYTRLLSQFRQSTEADRDACPELFRSEAPEVFAVELGFGYRLFSSMCWMGAYNWDMEYWLERKGDVRRLSDLSGDYEGNGEVVAMHLGRGIGDCRFVTSWVFDGSDMVKSGNYGTGLCRNIELGGIDPMPTFVSQVEVVPDLNRLSLSHWGEYSSTNQIVWDPAHVPFLSGFFGELKPFAKGSYFWHDGLVVAQIRDGLGGPPDAIRKLDENTLLASACRLHSCFEKAAMVVNLETKQAMFALIHYLDNGDGRMTVYYRDRGFRARHATALIEWASPYLRDPEPDWYRLEP